MTDEECDELLEEIVEDEQAGYYRAVAGVPDEYTELVDED